MTWMDWYNNLANAASDAEAGGFCSSGSNHQGGCRKSVARMRERGAGNAEMRPKAFAFDAKSRDQHVCA